MSMRPVYNLVIVLAFTACAHHVPTGGGGGGGQSGASSGPVPPGVRKAVDDMLGSSAKVSSELEDGATVYEAAVETKLEIVLSEQGKLNETEIAIPVASLPTAVASALAGKGTISGAEVVVRPGGVVFEILIGDTEYSLDASGKILAQEREQDEPGDEED